MTTQAEAANSSLSPLLLLGVESYPSHWVRIMRVIANPKMIAVFLRNTIIFRRYPCLQERLLLIER